MSMLTLRIGEVILNPDPEGTNTAIVATVRAEVHPEAPTFPGDIRQLNSLQRPHTDWKSFAQTMALEDTLFGAPRGWASQWGWVAPLRREQAMKVRGARLVAEKELYRDVVPAFGPPGDFSNYSVHFATIIWLDWWVSWAFQNCQRPGVCCTGVV